MANDIGSRMDHVGWIVPETQEIWFFSGNCPLRVSSSSVRFLSFLFCFCVFFWSYLDMDFFIYDFDCSQHRRFVEIQGE